MDVLTAPQERATLERLVAKRRLTPDERTELWLAIEGPRTRARHVAAKAWLARLDVDELERLHAALGGDDVDLAAIDDLIRAHPHHEGVHDG